MQQDKIIIKLGNYIKTLEEVIVTTLLSSILILAIIQIILRNIFNDGLLWGESLLRVLVLWLGMAGAILATHQGKQINIDVLSQFLTTRYRCYFRKLSHLFVSIVCMIISYYSFIFVVYEYELGSYALKNIPAWLAESVIPVSFFIMGIRYLINIFTPEDQS